MKKILMTIVLIASISVVALAEKQTVKLYVPEMECNTCKGKVENVLAYEKGVRKLDFNITERTVTIVFEDKKTNVAKLQAALIKFLKYESKEVKAGSCTSTCTQKQPASSCSSTCGGHHHDTPTHKH